MNSNPSKTHKDFPTRRKVKKEDQEGRKEGRKARSGRRVRDGRKEDKGRKVRKERRKAS